MKIPLFSTSGSSTTQAVNEVVFAAEQNKVVLAQAMRVYLSNLRQGTSKVKTRSEINRTKKKWFKQKGTGNARHGARTPNIFVGGGVSHGPNGEQNWTLNLPQTIKRQALIQALSLQAGQQAVLVHEGVEQVSGKTKDAAKIMSLVAKPKDKVLVVVSTNTPMMIRSYNNLSQVLVMSAARVTALEVAEADKVVFSPAGLSGLEQRLDKGKPVAKSVATKPKVAPIEVKAKVEKVPAKKVAVKSVATKQAATKPKVAAVAKPKAKVKAVAKKTK